MLSQNFDSAAITDIRIVGKNNFFSFEISKF